MNRKEILKKAKDIYDSGIPSTIAKVTGNVGVNLLSTNGQNIDFESLFNTPIEKYCLGEMARRQQLRLFAMNLFERNMTLYKLGDSVSGMANRVSDEVHDFDYEYTRNNNYLHDYQMSADKTTTQTKPDTNNFQRYNEEGHNTLYGMTTNAYYDDNGTGKDEFSKTRKIENYDANRNINSILRKTKQLFMDRKVNTIISRFHTDNENLNYNDTSETARSAYGLSHGRNLLTYDAERNGISYDTNGYNNPYCRVWTHHHQYSQQRSRLMRPFYSKDNKGEATSEGTQESFNIWKEFNGETDKKGKVKEYKWKNEEGASGWKHSVLKKGLVNITPKFSGGAEMNVHTRDCMFSIENLAWQGYDPYSFEQALSWEQRGPFGGRIMWFPPYGLNFNEGVSVNWNEHSFIGRGENVYTYTNTSRTGTLSFMMVVDHPSILDYATWHNPSDLKDTDIMRFFAGCDDVGTTASDNGDNGGSGAKNGILQSFAKPTPLTDEYLEADKTLAIEAKPENKKPGTQDGQSEQSPQEEIEIKFYAFFPNNYSGYFDRQDEKKWVEPVAYLLFGKGSGKTYEGEEANNLECNFNIPNFTESSTIGTGYEMKGNDSNGDLDKDGNYIFGTNYNLNNYIINKKKKWYYRIDGEYKPPIRSNEIKNCYAQTLLKYREGQLVKPPQIDPDRMKNKESFKLNESGLFETGLNILGVKNKDNNIYSLAEVAYALYYTDKPECANKIKENSEKLDSDRVEQLQKYFNKEEWKVTKIECKGFSNEQGDNIKTVNNQRNEFLAWQRRNTIIEWFRKAYNDDKLEVVGNTDDTIDSKQITSGVQVVNKHNESALDCKVNRCAVATLYIKTTKISEPAQQNQTQSNQGTKATVMEDGKEPKIVEDTISAAEYDNKTPEERNKYEVETYCLTNSAFVPTGPLNEEESGLDIHIDSKKYNNDLSKDERKLYIPEKYGLKDEKHNVVKDKKFSYVDSGKYMVKYKSYDCKYKIKEGGEILNEKQYKDRCGQTSNNKDLQFCAFGIEIDRCECCISEKLPNKITADQYITKLRATEQNYYEPISYVLIKKAKKSTRNNSNNNYSQIIPADDYENKLNGQEKKLYIPFTYKKKAEAKQAEIEGGGGNATRQAESGYVKFVGWEYQKESKDGTSLYIPASDTSQKYKLTKEQREAYWFYNYETKQMNIWNPKKQTLRNGYKWQDDYAKDFIKKNDINDLRYDQEYYFFKELKAKDPDVFSSLMKKLQYFDPAFHSMTPEGFMGRLNFLHQCTRQGNTTTASDKNGSSANNLAFGRPPFCILRLGDFYYQKIVIRSIDINYDPLVLDLNNEGVGVVPLIANVSITFNFIGGGDLTGPVRRLQNAMAFNYYANGRLYDNRADRIEREGTNNWDSMDMSKVDFKESCFYDTKMKTPN